MADDNVMAALDKVLATYKTGGEFSTQRASQLKTQERKYTSGAQQGLVSRGLAGTTVAQSIPAAFEQEVAAPYRTETERLRSGQEMQGLLAKAGFLQADEERALQEKLATADITSREKIARMGRGSTRTSSTSQMSTMASRDAARKAELAAAEASRAGGSGSTGTSQHVGGMGSLDLGIDYGGGGSAPAYAEPTFNNAPDGGGGTSGPSRAMLGESISTGGDQEMSLDDLNKLAEQWMNNDPNSLGDALPEGAVSQDEKWVYYEYYPGGPRYSVSKESGGRRM